MADGIDEIKLEEVDGTDKPKTKKGGLFGRKKKKVAITPTVEIEAELAAPGADPKFLKRRLDSAITKAISTLEVDDHLLELATAYHDADTYDLATAAAREVQGYVNDRLRGYVGSLRLDQAMKYTRAKSIVAIVRGKPRELAIIATVRGKQQFLRSWEAEARGYFIVKIGENANA